ncbi:MAG: tyrosine-type recombinase/integrase [Alphaproteobacteria bacterium]
MGSIIERMRKDGTPSFTALIRKKRAGKVILTLTETFAKESDAKKWIKRQETELKKKGTIDQLIRKKQPKSWAEVIDNYVNSSPDEFGKTKGANLSYLQRLGFGQMHVEDTNSYDFVILAQDLLNGVQAPPADPCRDCPEHYKLRPRTPQTVQSYMATLGTVVRYGGPLSGIELPIGEFETALRTLRHHKMIKKSETRNRRPTLEEMGRLIEHFYKNYQADPRRVPMHKLLGAAIVLGHRQRALCSLKWPDYAPERERLLIRGMKHPRGSEGNDVEVWITNEGMRIIDSMPRNSDRIFPYHPDTVSRLFTEAVDILKIEDLHFHDLRHEAISRMFEIGLGNASRDFILRYTGHSPDGSLTRYVHIEQSGDKYEGWPYWQLIFDPL